jgi:hypothetical protein
MTRYICTSGVGEDKRGLFYSASLNRTRIYRRDFKEPGKQFRIKEFAFKNSAQKLCDAINEDYKDNFVVEEIQVEDKKKTIVFDIETGGLNPNRTYIKSE